jgi:uncharacterized membrane protein
MVSTDTSLQLALYAVSVFAAWQAGAAFGKTVAQTMTIAEARETVLAADLAIDAARLRHVTATIIPFQVAP